MCLNLFGCTNGLNEFFMLLTPIALFWCWNVASGSNSRLRSSGPLCRLYIRFNFGSLINKYWILESNMNYLKSKKVELLTATRCLSASYCFLFLDLVLAHISSCFCRRSGAKQRWHMLQAFSASVFLGDGVTRDCWKLIIFKFKKEM